MAESQRHTRLQKLTGSDFEISKGDPDIRGWIVKDGNGDILGRVQELIFDLQSRLAKYIVVDLDGNDVNLSRREVLVPVGIAETDPKLDEVMIPAITPEQLNSLPDYVEARFDTEDEISILNVFGGLGAAVLSGRAGQDDFYGHEHFNEANLYRNRRNE
ncbi:MAG: PRC-barrel domain-containing protein [Chitinophagaceae bacterium]